MVKMNLDLLDTKFDNMGDTIGRRLEGESTEQYSSNVPLPLT